jgi:hypothetical protein
LNTTKITFRIRVNLGRRLAASAVLAEQMDALYSMFCNVFGSIGISIGTTLVIERSQAHDLFAKTRNGKQSPIRAIVRLVEGLAEANGRFSALAVC